MLHFHENTARQFRPVATARYSRVLIVDDNVLNRKIARHMLEQLGYQASCVFTASNGVEAIACISSKMFDIILMDRYKNAVLSVCLCVCCLCVFVCSCACVCVCVWVCVFVCVCFCLPYRTRNTHARTRAHNTRAHTQTQLVATLIYDTFRHTPCINVNLFIYLLTVKCPLWAARRQRDAFDSDGLLGRTQTGRISSAPLPLPLSKRVRHASRAVCMIALVCGQ